MRRRPWPWGRPKTETYFRVSLPAAKSGIAASIVLGVGRAIGEAMAIIMVSGNVANMPGLLKSVRFLTTAIASEMSYAAYGSLQRQALFSIGLVLFLFIMLINVILNVCIKREGEIDIAKTAHRQATALRRGACARLMYGSAVTHLCAAAVSHRVYLV